MHTNVLTDNYTPPIHGHERNLTRSAQTTTTVRFDFGIFDFYFYQNYHFSRVNRRISCLEICCFGWLGVCAFRSSEIFICNFQSAPFLRLDCLACVLLLMPIMPISIIYKMGKAFASNRLCALLILSSATIDGRKLKMRLFCERFLLLFAAVVVVVVGSCVLLYVPCITHKYQTRRACTTNGEFGEKEGRKRERD